MANSDYDEEMRLATQLHRLIGAIEATGHAVLPRTNLALLQSIVEAAARIFDAAAAAIALISKDRQELEFKVAYNVVSQDIVGMRFPINQGIAGYTAMTGQPLAVSSVDQDARFNREFAEQTGYIPQSILAVPLLLGEEVLGVIEVLDKFSARSFDMQDIELLTIFANQAALAISQSQQLDQLQAALLTGLKQLVMNDGEGEMAGQSVARQHFLNILNNQPASDDTLIQLAELIKDVSDLGETERRACWQILRVFQEYSRAKPPMHLSGGFRL